MLKYQIFLAGKFGKKASCVSPQRLPFPSQNSKTPGQCRAIASLIRRTAGTRILKGPPGCLPHPFDTIIVAQPAQKGVSLLLQNPKTSVSFFGETLGNFLKKVPQTPQKLLIKENTIDTISTTFQIKTLLSPALSKNSVPSGFRGTCPEFSCRVPCGCGTFGIPTKQHVTLSGDNLFQKFLLTSLPQRSKKPGQMTGLVLSFINRTADVFLIFEKRLREACLISLTIVL